MGVKTMASAKYKPVWRGLTFLARLDMIAGIVIAAALLAWLVGQ
jgi:hypothetical protein